MEFGYWPVKGLAEYQRWVLAYCKAPYTEKTVTEFGKWSQERDSLGLAFPNLPYLIDGDIKITESQAIAFYIGGKYKPELIGVDLAEQTMIRMLSGVFHDILEGFQAIYSKHDDYKAAIENDFKFKKAQDKVAHLAKYLGTKEFFQGHITLNDLEFGPLYQRVRAICRTHGVENPFEKYSNLVALYGRLKGLPGLKEYLESDANKRPESLPGYLAVTLKED
jgi:glutathione S-transferase